MAVLKPTPVPTPGGPTLDLSKGTSIPGLSWNTPQPVQVPQSSGSTLGMQAPTSGGGSTAPSSGFNYQPTITSPSTPLGGGGSEMDAINNEFNNFNSYLDSQANTANQNFNETKGLYDTMKTNAQAQYDTQRGTQIDQTKKTESLNLAKVRQLLSDLTQSNAARTAVTGGGSVSEALGEKFGRTAQSSLGNVIDSTKQQLDRVNQFYDTALTKLNETYQSNVLQAKQTLDDNLSQIQGARVQSAAAKQAATIDAWKSYYNNVNQAKIQAAQFKAQYDMWAQQQQSALSAVAGQNQSSWDTYTGSLANSYNIPGTPDVNNPAAAVINPYYQTKPKNPNDPNQDPYTSPTFLQNSTVGTS